MRKILLMLFLIHLAIPKGKAWGFFGHKLANELAIYTLRGDLFAFYKSNLDFIRSHAVDADKRRYLVEDEGYNHYIDVDYFEKQMPIDTLRLPLDSLYILYDSSLLKTSGFGPWNLTYKYYSLKKAFELKDQMRILKLSADIGHYMSDLHVPLHTNSNYNGQKSNQLGIHGLWETRTLEKYHTSYWLHCKEAAYLYDLRSFIWDRVEESYILSATVLQMDSLVKTELTDAQEYSFEERNGKKYKTFSDKYVSQYHKLLDGMIEERLKASAYAIGSIWYTAWIDAGQPDLQFQSQIFEHKDTTVYREKMLGRQE
jgi:hypothetical protein